MLTLTPTERRALRAKAHALAPVVMIGQQGLTPAVLREIDRALNAHELIKVRIFSDDRAEREALQLTICQQLVCAPVQHVGKLLVLWRPAPPKKETAPKPAKRPAKKAPPAPGAINRRGQAIKPLSARQARQQAQPPDDSAPFADDRRPPRPAGRGSRGQTPRSPAFAGDPPPDQRRGGRSAAASSLKKRATATSPQPRSSNYVSGHASSATRPAGRRRLGSRGKA